MWDDAFGALDDLLIRVCTGLQLTQTQYERAEDRYGTIGGWLDARDSPLATWAPIIYPQGSLRIGTTVRPLARQEYDLDLVCEFSRMDPRSVPDPVKLLDLVEYRLRQHDIYRERLERKTRCLRVTYANDFHLDVLPACPDPSSGAGCVVVPDREAGWWVASNPRGYAAWFEARAAMALAEIAKRVEPLPLPEPLSVKPPLKRIVQLMKRWRDRAYRAQSDKAPISIVLTTLAATHYTGEVSPARALGLVLDSVTATIPPPGRRLVVLNPTNAREDLSERWDTEAGMYAAFVEGIRAFQAKWQTLVQVSGTARLLAALGELFGSDLIERALREQGDAIQKARSTGGLAVRRQTGTLVQAGAVASVPVKRNTFYGV
jgi:hypothetical protein